MDFDKLENIIFTAACGAAALLLLIVTIVVIAKGKRKCKAGDVVFRIFASLALVVSAIMLASSIFTGLNGSLAIKIETNTATFVAWSYTLVLPVPQLFIALSTTLGQEISIVLVILSLIGLIADCVLANVKDKKSKNSATAMTDTERKRAEDIEKIKRIGDSAVQKSSAVADSASASKKIDGPSEPENKTPEPDWRVDNPAVKPDKFVGLSDDPDDDFDSFDSDPSDAGMTHIDEQRDAPANAPENVWAGIYDQTDELFEENAPIKEETTDEETPAPESEPEESIEELSDEPLPAAEELEREFESNDERTPDPDTDAREEEINDTERAFESDEDRSLSEDELPDDDFDEDERLADDAEIESGSQSDRESEDLGVDTDTNDDEFDDIDDASDNIGDFFDDAQPASDAENYTQSVEENKDTYAHATDDITYGKSEEPEKAGEYSDIEPDRDIYIPEIRTVSKRKNTSAAKPAAAKKPASKKSAGTTKKPAAKKAGPAAKPAATEKPISGEKPAAAPKTKTAASKKPTAKTSTAKKNAPEKKLPVTRRYVILDRRSAVNIFNDYLKERERSDKDKLESSISTIILK